MSKQTKLNMEQVNAEKETVSTTTSKLKVLTIGDQESTSKPKVLTIGDQKGSTSKKPHNNLRNKVRQHLGLILMGTRTPNEVIENWESMEHFGVASIKEDNQPRRYHFYCKRSRHFPPRTILYGPTFEAQRVMDHLREGLREENWISENVIETPLKTKTSSSPYYNYDAYIQEKVFEAMGVEEMRIFNFVLYLHRQNMKNSSTRKYPVCMDNVS